MKLFSPASFLDPSLAMSEVEAALNKCWAAIYNFEAGELPEAPTDGVLYGRQSAAWSAVPSTAADGADGQVQYNSSGKFAGAVNFTISNGNPNVTAGNHYLYAGADVIHGDPANGSYYFGGAGQGAAGANNTGMGRQALGSNSSGIENTAIGQTSLADNQSGSYNTAVGSYALWHAGGNWNTCIGRTSGYLLTTGSSNTIVGPYPATSAMSNAVVLANGSGVAKFSASGNNVGIGGSGDPTSWTGEYNVAIGAVSANALTTGGSNTVIGNYAGYYLTTGSGNTFIGPHAGQSVTNGGNNTFIGYWLGNANDSNQVVLADGQGFLAVQYDCPNKTWQTLTTTVGALPAAGVVGRRAFVTDANAATFNAVLAGGGSNKLPVFDDGTNWRIG